MSASFSERKGSAPARASSSISGVTSAARSWAMVSYRREALPAGFLPKQRRLPASEAAMEPMTMTEPCLERVRRPPVRPRKRANVVTDVSNTTPWRRATALSTSKVSLSSQKMTVFRSASSPAQNPARADTVGAM